MKIFKVNNIPVKAHKGIRWEQKENWVIEINGERLYGAKSKKDLEKHAQVEWEHW